MGVSPDGMSIRYAIYAGLFLVALVQIVALLLAWPRQRITALRPIAGAIAVAIGFVTNFFDTLGIGSFATTTSLYKFLRFVPDERIPGTLNVGHTLPTIVEAAIFIVIVAVEPPTLILLIAASVVGAWLGAGFVARLPRRSVQIGMGTALTVAAVLFIMMNLKGKSIRPNRKCARARPGSRLWIGDRRKSLLGRADDDRHRLVRAVHDHGEPSRHESNCGVSDHDGILRVPNAGREPALHPLQRLLDACRAWT